MKTALSAVSVADPPRFLGTAAWLILGLAASVPEQKRCMTWQWKLSVHDHLSPFLHGHGNGQS